MKKLLSILLTLVMVFSLTVPAFADGPQGPAPDDYYDDYYDPDYAEWCKEYWAETCADYPEETALFLTEVEDWFSSSYRIYLYGSYEDFCANHVNMEDVYTDLFWEWQSYHEAEQAKRDFITSHGGVPGQINVMVDGKCVKFPDAAPEVAEGRTMVPVRAITEALGGEVDYGFAGQEGAVRLLVDKYTIQFTIGGTTAQRHTRGTDTGEDDKTIEMDCAPYAKGGRTYVPVRFFAEALGYDVQWDDYYQTVVITDLTALAEQIDKDFTVYNKLMVKSALTDKTQKSVGSGKADVTLFDTLNGDKTGKATYSYDLAASTAGASGKLEYDFTELWALIEGYIPMPLDLAGEEEYTQALELVKSLMKGSMEVRVDLETGKAYLSAPGLFEAMGDQLAAAGVQLPKDAWLSTSLGDSADMDELIAMMGQTLTMGKLLTTMGSSGYCAAENYDDTLEMAEAFGKLYGDAKFKRQGSGYVLTLTREDLKEYLEALVGEDDYTVSSLDTLSKFEYSLTVKDNGDMDVSAQCNVALSGDGLNLGDMAAISSKGSTRGGKSESTMEVHVRNVLKATVTLEQTVTETDKAPEVTPPSDVLVLPMDGELPGGTITSPDGPTQVQP